jgi:hypothetical protein
MKNEARGRLFFFVSPDKKESSLTPEETKTKHATYRHLLPKATRPKRKFLKE